ncbi:WD40-repeat-containing domain protein [Lipomyces orientalis]|uniref:WD40-repeat-containing domain protein n=1 Tax=Lipomyces orientalis TaxID=1233043 RepID=A0ACC3TX49_9ASCO
MPIKQVHSIPAHVDRIWNLAPHPTLPLLATATSDKAAQIYSLNTYFPVAQLDGNHKRSIRSVSWKPKTGGNSEVVLATASFDGTVGIWIRDNDRFVQDVGSTGVIDDSGSIGLEEWEFVASLEGHENEVKGVDWSCEGTYLASCSRDKSVWIWEADESNEEFECLAVLQDHTQDVKHVAWHPNEELLASASYDDTIRLWREDDDDWVCSGEIIGHRSTVWCIDFDKMTGDGEARLVSCSADETVRVWSRQSMTGKIGSRDFPSTFRSDPVSENWQQEAILPQRHSGPIYAVSWSGRSGRIVSVGADGLLIVYQEVNKGEWVVIAEEEDAHSVFEINTAVWSKKWKSTAPHGQEGGAEKDETNPDNEEIIITGGDDGNINIWEVTIQK